MVKTSIILQDIETHKEITFPLILVGLFLIFVANTGIDQLVELFDFKILVENFEILGRDFVNAVGALAIFLYGFVPSAFKIIGTTGFFISLLLDGVNPFVLVILGAIGESIGSAILYLVGRGFFKFVRNRGIDKKIASADHLLTKYRIFIFFAVPFLGTAGDILMTIAGHERIGILKVFPFLFLGNFFRYGIWLMVTISQMNL